MRLELDAPVRCSDGEAGALADVVVDPERNAITHLVIRSRGDSERLVPFELAEAAGGGVALCCTRAQLARRPSPEAVEFLPAGSFPEGGATWDVGVETAVPIASPSSLEFGDFAGDFATELEIVYDRVPKGMIELRRSSLIESTDGEVVGAVDALVLDGAQITHLVVRSGHLWWRREHAVPIASVSRLETDVVITTLLGSDVPALPPAP